MTTINPIFIDETSSQVTISAQIDGHRRSVTVYKNREKYGGNPYPAQVNWSALGSCSAAEARLYGQMIQTAADYADEENASREIPAGYDSLADYEEDQAAAAETIRNGDY